VAHPDPCAHPQRPSCFRGCGGGSVPLASRELLCLSRMPRARQQKTEGTKEEVWWTRGSHKMCLQPEGVKELSTQIPRPRTGDRVEGRNTVGLHGMARSVVEVADLRCRDARRELTQLIRVTKFVETAQRGEGSLSPHGPMRARGPGTSRASPHSTDQRKRRKDPLTGRDPVSDQNENAQHPAPPPIPNTSQNPRTVMPRTNATTQFRFQGEMTPPPQRSKDLQDTSVVGISPS